jgi:hypothetical protein
LNIKDAGLPAPRLQIAKTGFRIGEAKVMVLVPVNAPARVMMSPTVLGESVTVPPIKELLGNQLVALPLITLLLKTSPE